VPCKRPLLGSVRHDSTNALRDIFIARNPSTFRCVFGANKCLLIKDNNGDYPRRATAFTLYVGIGVQGVSNLSSGRYKSREAQSRDY
jgi:hypothetical protein